MNRRSLLAKTSLATAAGLNILKAPLRGANAPSNKLVIAVMGVNGRGTYHLRQFSKLPGVEVGYICDVEDAAIKKGFNAPIDDAHKSVLLCHLANIAQRTGAALPCDPKDGRVIGHAAATALWSRSYEPGWEMKLRCTAGPTGNA